MIKLIRNMSKEELADLHIGNNIEGRTKIQEYNKKTKYVVCFFPISEEYQANTWFYDVCVVFEAKEEIFEKTSGVYPNWNSPSWEDTNVLTEYHIIKYNKYIVKPLYYYWTKESNKKYYF